MKTLGSVAAVVAALRDEGREQAEQVLAAADARVSAPPPGGQDGAPLPASEARRAAARRRARERLAVEDLADSRAALEARAAFFVRAAEEGGKLLRAPEPDEVRRDRLHALAAEAIARLPGDRELIVALSPEDAAVMGEGPAPALGPRVVVVADAALGPADCLVRTADGRLAVDNGVEARVRQFEPVWRAALAELHR
jgi:vacuolar-type H+-ATPase subunit E/Vma4